MTKTPPKFALQTPANPGLPEPVSAVLKDTSENHTVLITCQQGGRSMARMWGSAALMGGVLLAGSAVAESYRLVSGNSNALMITDMDGIRRTGDVASFNTVMFSRRIEHFNGRASWATRTANEINCRTNQRREVRSTYLSEGGGVISSDAGGGEWQPIPRGSTGWAIRDLACDRRLTSNNIEFGSSFSQAEQMARRVLGH